MASQAVSSSGAGNRVVIAIAGVVMQVALGAVYAWSVFRDALTEAYGGASATAVNTTFSITIFTLGFAAFVGGLWMGRSGPRIVALTAGVLYGIGVFLASFAESSLTLLYLTYGFIAGAGIGLGYIVPVATLIKWFPDKRGFITGIAVAGFGGGAFAEAGILQLRLEMHLALFGGVRLHVVVLHGDGIGHLRSALHLHLHLVLADAQQLGEGRQLDSANGVIVELHRLADLLAIDQ